MKQQDCKEIRLSLKLSQTQFSEKFGIPVGTIRNWEQKKRDPDQASNILLCVIKLSPHTVAAAINAETI